MTNIFSNSEIFEVTDLCSKVTNISSEVPSVTLLLVVIIVVDVNIWQYIYIYIGH